MADNPQTPKPKPPASTTDKAGGEARGAAASNPPKAPQGQKRPAQGGKGPHAKEAGPHPLRKKVAEKNAEIASLKES